MAHPNSIEALTALGFTNLEAEIYTFLLQEAPVTGYRVAQAIGKPVANTYKAIEALVNKGAVIQEEGQGRLCRAVPAEELLSGLERSFAERKGQAARALAELKRPAGDEGVYHLKTPEQVMERCRRMIAGARTVVMLDCFPRPLEELRPDLEAAAGRGVTVSVQAYAPFAAEGARVVYFPQPRRVLEGYVGDWIILVVDGSQLLLGFLSRDGREVLQAVWSESVHIAWLFQAFMTSEFIFGATLADPETPLVVREIAARHRGLCPMGHEDYQRLMRERGYTVGGGDAPPEEDTG